MHSRYNVANDDYNQEWRYEGFEPTADDQLKESMMGEWSPIVWDTGRRKIKNFLYADWCGLDFDGDCPPLREAIGNWQGYKGYIGPTRNNGLEKNGVVADRYRVVIQFEQRISDRDLYKHNMKTWVSRFNADKKCVDCGRYFFPCSEVMVLGGSNRMPVLEIPRVDLYALKQRYLQSKSMPKHVDDFLKSGAYGHFGGRNNACFVAACRLKDRGMSEVEAISAIMASPFTRIDFAEREIVTAVNSAFRR